MSADVPLLRCRLPDGLSSSTFCATHERNIWECVAEVVPLAVAEQRAIERAMDAYQGSQIAAARALGISRRTLYTKLLQYTAPARRGQCNGFQDLWPRRAHGGGRDCQASPDRAGGRERSGLAG